PSSANAHMNYLIIFLKSDSLKLDIGSMTGAACLSEEGVFYAFHGVCQPLISRWTSASNISLTS
ncbi:hypothetical protein, partial [Vreelandella malpeensis]|uniref:hypothetical protein n=1 Tax=Vreelandella malpeensis TaxID=1172368 RepID=UPI001D0A168E